LAQKRYKLSCKGQSLSRKKNCAIVIQSMTSQKLYELERKTASLLLDKLEHQEITLHRAAQIAQYITKALPDNITDNQIDSFIPQLDDTFIELAGIVHTHMKELDEIKSKNIATEAERLLKEHKFSEALSIMNTHLANKL